MAKADQKTCPECGEAFERRHHLQLFCSKAHQVAYNNRQLARGQAMVGLAQAWRAARNYSDPAAKEAGKAAFRQLCALADKANAEDRAAGRANPVQVFKVRMAAWLLSSQRL